VQVEPSDPSKASQAVTVLIEALPPVLIVHLNRFHYDTVAAGVVKNHKHVQFSPELDIPPGTFFFSLPRGRELIVARSPQISWYLQPDDPWCRRDTRSMECSTTTARPQAEDIIRWPCSTRTHMGAVERLGCTSDEIVSAVEHEEVFWRYDSERTDDWCAYLFRTVLLLSTDMMTSYLRILPLRVPLSSLHHSPFIWYLLCTKLLYTTGPMTQCIRVIYHYIIPHVFRTVSLNLLLLLKMCVRPTFVCPA
jgi:hypothetical protein